MERVPSFIWTGDSYMGEDAVAYHYKFGDPEQRLHLLNKEIKVMSLSYEFLKVGVVVLANETDYQVKWILPLWRTSSRGSIGTSSRMLFFKYFSTGISILESAGIHQKLAH